MLRRVAVVGLLLSAIIFSAPSQAASTADTDPAIQAPIDALNGVLLEVMKAGATLDFAAREQKLEPVIRKVFDLRFMAQRTVGQYWNEMSEADRGRFVDAFSRWTVATYASNFDGYDGETFETLGTDKSTNTVWVRTRLNLPGKDPVSLNYVMREQPNHDWQVADVFYNGSVSEITRRRSEFQGVIRAKKLDGLIAALDDKTKQLAKPKPAP